MKTHYALRLYFLSVVPPVTCKSAIVNELKRTKNEDFDFILQREHVIFMSHDMGELILSAKDSHLYALKERLQVDRFAELLCSEDK